MGSYKFGSVHQTQLGSLDGGHLTVIKPPGGYKSSQGHAPILKLPAEILLEIFKYVVFEVPIQRKSKYTAAMRLAVVCRRFNSLVLPLFYHQITVSVRGKSSLSLRKLHAVLRDKPSIRDYCKKLDLCLAYNDELSKDSISMLNDLVSYLTKVRILMISCGPKQSPHHTVRLFQIAAQHMRHVDRLRFNHHCNTFFAQDILKHVDFPSLRNLEIEAIWVSGRDTRSRHITALEPNMHRTGTFTSLRIECYQEDFEALEQLIQWPKSLEHFELFPDEPLPSTYIDLPMLGAYLSIHKDTLRSIRIGYLSLDGREELFDISEFSKLEVLDLSWQQTERLLFQDANFLLALKLHTLKLRFGHLDSSGIHYFGELEEHLVREFAKAAIAKKAALRFIYILFYPTIQSLQEEPEYPWDRMDSIQEEIGPHGLTLYYNRPLLTKQQWIDYTDGLSLWPPNEFGFEDEDQDEDMDEDGDEAEFYESDVSRERSDIRDYLEYDF